MKKILRDRIAGLAAMNVPALPEEHRKIFGEEPASAHRQFLFRKIAWRLQADEEGGLSEAARELTGGIARDAPLRNRVITNAAKRRLSDRPPTGVGERRAGWRRVGARLQAWSGGRRICERARRGRSGRRAAVFADSQARDAESDGV
jgi:hypothetical protein